MTKLAFGQTRPHQKDSSLLANIALSIVRQGMPFKIGKACPSSGQNQQSGRLTKAAPLTGDTKQVSDAGPGDDFSTTISAASLCGFELYGQRSTSFAG
jgi:hypothetical protein